ncbi:MAG: hypothetical protein HKN47_00390 [Pirellulaceae bacterium]|nr:hypothetical protein [Pirellulaceae bacterium]
MIQRELPIKIVFTDAVTRPRKSNQHIKRVRVAGSEDSFPEELRLEADEIADGGTLTIEDLSLPGDLEVVDRRDRDPIITVEMPKKDKRPRHDHRDHDDDDD